MTGRTKSKPAKKKTSEAKKVDGIDSQSDVCASPSGNTVKPEIQIQLTEAELEEEIAQMLTANNPLAEDNITRFHSKERCFKIEAMIEQSEVHFATDGWLIAKDSEEGKRQLELERLQEEALSKVAAEVAKQDETGGYDAEDPKQLRNHFNFSDRASQTASAYPKSRLCYTEPPKTTTRNGSCSQWETFDDYNRDMELQKLQEQENKRKHEAGKRQQKMDEFAAAVKTKDSPEDRTSLRAVKVVERMTMQNIFEEFGMDFKYWDDASDAFRPNEGSLLPLWQFGDDAQDEGHAMCICFNTKHTDVFAVGFGSYVSTKHTVGRIKIYSLKNPSVPETCFSLNSGVVSAAFHPEYPCLLAAGLYDGTVVVLTSEGERLHQGSSGGDPVWQIHWKQRTTELELYSASADGRLGLWAFTKSEALFEPIMSISNPEGSTSGLLCLHFNQADDTVYLVGSEEGRIYRCSTEYDSEYLDVYMGHDQPVYNVKWNFYHPDVFLAASEDWNVSLWDTRFSRKAVSTFELNAPVTDVAWAPYSSTVFAAITATGYVFVYDLNSNRQVPMCEQRIANKGRLTKLVFHPRDPLLLVGNTMGCVISLKLSPNLRKDLSNGIDAERQKKKIDHIVRMALKTIS